LVLGIRNKPGLLLLRALCFPGNINSGDQAFYGTSENAVKTQIWIAISIYVLIAIIRKRLNLRLSLYTILQILSVALFEKIPILQAFAEDRYATEDTQPWEQLELQGISLGQ